MRLLIILLLFISCDNLSRSNPLRNQSLNPKASLVRLDTIRTKPYVVTANPKIFETAFFPGSQAKIDTFDINFYSVDIGKLKVESGKVIACDPIVMHDAKPFSQTFPIGQFSVQLAIAKINDDERVAFSRVLFSENPVTKWEFALHDGQNQVPIEGEALYGYGVDGGVGLFMDKEANDNFNSMYKKNKDIWSRVFIDEMSKNSRKNWEYVLYNFEQYNLTAFSTGYGDGTYGTYIGFDAKGNVCRLLTDFALVEWWKK